MATKTATTRFFDGILFDDDCCKWIAGKNPRGYGKLWAEGKTFAAHRFSYELFNGPIPEGLCVLHSCDNPACVKPTHLFLGTNADNTNDMVSKGRDRWIGAPVSEEGVHNFNWREIAKTPGSQRQVGKLFGVSHASVWKYRKMFVLQGE